METRRPYGKPHEETLIQQSSIEPETPTVGPLRINKWEYPNGPPNGSGPGSAYAHFPQPSSQAYPQSEFSSTGEYLPSPNDYKRQQAAEGRQVYTPQSDRSNTSPDHRRRLSNGTPQLLSSPRTRFDASDPNRPSVAGYSQPRQGTEESDAESYSSRFGERRVHTPKPLPESPGPETPEKEGLFQKLPNRLAAAPQATGDDSGQSTEITESYRQQYYPPPSELIASSNPARLGLSIPNHEGVNRLASTASVSTTKAARGSPPPPETPATDYQSGNSIEARYAAAGIAGPSTLTSLQAHNLAAQQRLNQQQTLSPPPQHRETPQRTWTPTEHPGTAPGGPAVSLPGTNEANGNYSPPRGSDDVARSSSRLPRQNHVEQDMQRMHLSEEPPPAYSSVSHPGQGYRQEKRTARGGTTRPGAPVQQVSVTASTNREDHPAFANDPVQPDSRVQDVASPIPSRAGTVHSQTQQSPSPALSGASPPPLPEGWIAHLDPNSRQYYYIHLPTQSTQWEFPKGPTPLNLNEPPLSPTGTLVNQPLNSPAVTTFSGKPMTSPGFPPQQAYSRESMMTMATMSSLSSPTAAGFTGPPPMSGVDRYKVAATNGVYFGPYLRYTNMDVDNGIWFGSILLVTDAPHPSTIHIHQSIDLSPDPRQLKANHIYQHQRWSFYRYDIDLKMDEDHDAKWTYAITSHLGCTRYEFLVAGRYETSWRFIAHSGNDFALNVNANERAKVGGIGYMWKDIVQKHLEVGGFHVQLGMGNQIYADRLWKEIPTLRQWTAMSGKENRKKAAWTAQHEEDVTHAYFHYYTSHFDQPHLREAFAQIPQILTLDDHDIFDGFGSYPEHMQFSNMFKNIGRIGIEMYLLFQHHTTLDILRNVSDDLDLFTITGTGWHFVKYLGPAVVVVGPDCRSERNPHQIMAGPTYQGLFPKVAILPPSVQHCLWLIPVPLIYPRLEAAEQFAHTMATGKKVATGTFNALGKVTSSVAGVVGAKGLVGEGFNSVKKAVGKSGLMSNVLSPFGEIDIMDELRDQWTHESKARFLRAPRETTLTTKQDLERTYLIRTLQGISHVKSLRMTFFSGAVNCCGAGLVHDPSHPSDHKTMYQIISSSVVNAPPSQYVLRMLHPNSHSSSNRPLYIPQNGHRSTPQNPTDTKEDMLEIFAQDVNGQPREMKRLMGRRNYAAVVIYDPEVVQGAFGTVMGAGKSPGRLSLAVDFMIQSEAGGYLPTATCKYGPVIVPSLEYGR